ncbi:MAG: translocation/assembly module TamB domain-containing protein [Bacteroidaceae bacterium]|nr:translocation/assembly module TamB domain-containing protein [Bacteroidaceae bacterium]
MRCYSDKDDCIIKKIKQIIQGIITGIITLYTCLIILVNIPAVQNQLGSWIADALSDKIGSEVSIGKVNVGFLNRLIIDDINIKDKSGQDLLKADRTAVKISIIKLLEGEISIGSAQLFGLDANLYKRTPQSEGNYQFLIDALSNDNEKSTPLHLNINTFILRRGHIKYNILSEKYTSNKFNVNHLDINDIDATLSLRELTDDNIDIVIRRFNFKENNSGFILKNFTAKINADKTHGIVTDFNFKAPQSSLYLDTLKFDYNTKDQTYSYNTYIYDSYITPSDFSALMPELKDITLPLYLSSTIQGDQDNININNFNIHSDDNLMRLKMNAYVSDLKNDATINADIQDFAIKHDEKQQLLSLIAPSLKSDIINNIGDIKYQGHLEASNNKIISNGYMLTDAGKIDMDINFTDNTYLKGNVTTDKLYLSKLLNNQSFGEAAFNLNIDAQLVKDRIPQGTLLGSIDKFEYNGKNYHNIDIDITSLKNVLDGSIKGKDHALRFDLEAIYNTANTDVDMSLHIDTADINIPSIKFPIKNINASLQGNLNGYKTINLNTDGIDANIQGNIKIEKIKDSFQNLLAKHIPALSDKSPNLNEDFDFNLSISQSPITEQFIPDGYTIKSPINIVGRINTQSDSLYMTIDAPSITNNNKIFTDTRAIVYSNKNLISATVNTTRAEEEEGNPTKLHLSVDAHDNKLHTLVKWDEEGTVYATTQFSDSLGKLKTNVHLHKSQFTINDTTWSIHPADITVFNKKIDLHNIKIANNDNNNKTQQYIILDGTVSESANDTVKAKLNNLEIAYITDIVDFSAVKLQGLASGEVVVAAALTKSPHLSANLIINNMYLQDGRLGTGFIQAFWDQENKGINLLGHIIDNYKGLDRATDISGYVAPATKQMDLKINTNNTNAEFLNGFLGSTFRDITGSTNGEIHVIGPLNDVNIVGDISADVNLRLNATGTMYHINPEDSLHLRLHQFCFDNIRLTDEGQRGTAVVNGTLSHYNMKNFKYDFDIKFNDISVYDEKEFNSDKFKATVFVNGTLNLHGADGHPLRMNAEITPCPGSVFAYDAATPDAISSSNFVEIREHQNYLPDFSFNKEEVVQTNESNIATTMQPSYKGDIFFDIIINITPDCEIKLRMDNVEDGYMSTFGTGTLLAHYHNKSPFSLNGIYQIQKGKYRLYLQDIIYRDLEIQPTSNVVFNGNPFDANIRLLCNHTINSVPLNDLTGTTLYNQNPKVKVICILDITGNLGNMNFGFDIMMPNVNDETRQLVRSLISTDEEMNMQMIYLLGLGRFYTNEYMRATGETNTTGAVNTLLSSTISGQINQMLSNVIGTNSKWNFGTGLATGEKGWNDLDIEGILSGTLLNDRLLINGNFGYRDNTLTNRANFIGDFDVRWRLSENGNTYIKAYNQTNDRYFTKATLNTQGIGISYQKDFDSWKRLFRRKSKEFNNK